jgi:nitrate/nitrite-specific signal transduction histidine kinase
MSIPEDPLKRSLEFAQMFTKAKEFTEELLKENERLRLKLAGAAAPAASDERARELSGRVRELEAELQEVRRRFNEVEAENKEFADRYVEIEEQNNNLANLYVASYQLHSTLDFKEVVRIVQEIVINLIGAEAFHIYMVGEKSGKLEREGSEGQEAPNVLDMSEGIIGTAARTGLSYFAEQVVVREPTPFALPIAVIPLKIKDSVIGVVSINKLLVQKKSFTNMDHELFKLLAGHAATAIFAAKLYSTSERKLSTLQGFLDMLKQPAK